MKSFLKTHCLMLIGLFVAMSAGLQIYMAVGYPKDVIKWSHVVGEGGTATICFIWMIMFLRSRPAGRITRLLSIGMCCVCFSMWMDMLDEFIKLPPEAAIWDILLEKAPMPIGMLLITLGIYHLHKEQQAIAAQMSKRERLFREYHLFDKLIPLNGAQYLRQHLKQALAQAETEQQPLSVIAIDLDDFSEINQVYGHEEGDQVLQVVAQLLLFNLRQQDVLCRLAGDRFVAVLPNTGAAQAMDMAEDMRQSVASVAHRTQRHGERLHLRATAVAAMAIDENEEQLLKRLNLLVANAKPRQPPRLPHHAA